MVTKDEDIYQSIPKDNTIFYWIPTFCNLLRSKSNVGNVKILIDVAKKEIKKIILSITNSDRNDTKNKYLLRMLPTNIDKSEIFRNKEMLCYQQALKLMEEYIKQESAKKLIKALMWYKQGEMNGKKYIESMTKMQNYQNMAGRYFC